MHGWGLCRVAREPALCLGVPSFPLFLLWISWFSFGSVSYSVDRLCRLSPDATSGGMLKWHAQLWTNSVSHDDKTTKETKKKTKNDQSTSSSAPNISSDEEQVALAKAWPVNENSQITIMARTKRHWGKHRSPPSDITLDVWSGDGLWAPDSFQNKQCTGPCSLKPHQCSWHCRTRPGMLVVVHHLCLSPDICQKGLCSVFECLQAHGLLLQVLFMNEWRNW